MKEIKQYWTNEDGEAIFMCHTSLESARKYKKIKEQQGKKVTIGKTVVEATFRAKCEEDGFYGKDRQTLQAAINDGKRHYKKTGNESTIWADWTETAYDLKEEYYYGKPDENEGGLVGYVTDGFYDMYNELW